MHFAEGTKSTHVALKHQMIEEDHLPPPNCSFVCFRFGVSDRNWHDIEELVLEIILDSIDEGVDGVLEGLILLSAQARPTQRVATTVASKARSKTCRMYRQYHEDLNTSSNCAHSYTSY